MTALGDPALLERVASAVLAVRGFWEDLARTSGGERLTRTAFVSAWLDAFVNGHSTSEALTIVDAFLAEARLSPDVRRKLLQSRDGLARAVRIREAFAK